MERHNFFAAVACLAILLCGCRETITTEESALTASDLVVSYSRTETRGTDEWFRPGRGPTTRLRYTVRTPDGLEVSTPERYPGTSLDLKVDPVALEIIGNDPVIVMQTRGKLCDAYGYPPEGHVAFRHRRGKWERISLHDLPTGASLNTQSTSWNSPQSDFGAEASRQVRERHRVKTTLNDFFEAHMDDDGSCFSRTRFAGGTYQDQRNLVLQAMHGEKVADLHLSEQAQARTGADHGAAETPVMEAILGKTSMMTPSCHQLIKKATSNGRGLEGGNLVHMRLRLYGDNLPAIDIPSCGNGLCPGDIAIACTPTRIAVSAIVPPLEGQPNFSTVVLVYDKTGKLEDRYYGSLPFVESSAKQTYRIRSLNISNRQISGVVHRIRYPDKSGDAVTDEMSYAFITAKHP